MPRTLPLLALLLVACDSGDPEPSITWSPLVEDDARGAYLMAWGASADEVWVVGGQPEVGVALRGTADGLEEVALPEGTPLLNWVHGTSATDVWVAGLDGALLHWDGAAWTDRSLEIDEALWGVHAVSPTEAWVVGGRSAWGGEIGRVYRWDGDAPTALELPEVLADLGNVFKVHHDGSRLWACGLGGAVLRSDDGATLKAVPGTFAGDIVTVHGLPGQDPIFVGGRGTGAVLELADGKIGATAQAPAGLSGVHVLPDGRAIVVGEGGYTGIYDVQADTLLGQPIDSDAVLHGVFVDGTGTAWAAGGNLYTSESSFSGAIWTGVLAEEEGP